MSFTAMALGPGVTDALQLGPEIKDSELAKRIVRSIPEGVRVFSDLALKGGAGSADDRVVWAITPGNREAEQSLFALGLRSDMLEELGFKLEPFSDDHEPAWLLEIQQAELEKLLVHFAHRLDVRKQFSGDRLNAIADATMMHMVAYWKHTSPEPA